MIPYAYDFLIFDFDNIFPPLAEFYEMEKKLNIYATLPKKRDYRVTCHVKHLTLKSHYKVT